MKNAPNVKYRPKSAVVDAYRIPLTQAELVETAPNWLGKAIGKINGAALSVSIGTGPILYLIVYSSEGGAYVGNPFDYVVRDHKGNLSVVYRKAFEKGYGVVK